MREAPKVQIEKCDLSSNRYCSNGQYWKTTTLIQYCKEKDYPIFDLPLAGVRLSITCWDIRDLSDFIHHSKRVQDADLSYPIILDDCGRICDGYHRLVKAIIEGNTTISAIRIEEMPDADGTETDDK